jgi:hypothetical protein
MKILNTLLVGVLTIALISCQQEEPEPGKKTGSLHIRIGLSVQMHDMNSMLKSSPQTGDFKVVIYRADGTEIMAFESFSVMPDTIELETGDYYVEAHSDNDLPAAFENPYYYGVSDIFTIGSNTVQSVLVTCELSNTIVSVVYSTNVASSFTDFSTTVSSALGSLIFLKNETRLGYFRPSPLDILVELTYQKPDGSDATKILTGSIADPLPNRHYEILVDASIDEGMTAFQVLIDSSEVLVEVIEVSEDTVTQQSGEVGYGDLLITEIMSNPSAMSDTYGEWFEIYNNSVHVVNLQNLILGRDDANRHTITEPIELAPGAYYVLARTDTATAAANSYTFGSDMLLPNTGAVLSLFNEGTETDPGALIFSVDYGGSGFPVGTGASISLDPDRLNAADALLGTSWCISTSIYSTGDMGTPGAGNDACQQ